MSRLLPFLRPTRPGPGGHDHTPPCPTCDGTGTRKWFDADCGYSHDRCPRCRGVATAGWFVLRAAVGTVSYEMSWQSRSFRAAVARAVRWAVLLAGRKTFLGVAGEVRVVFSPADPAAPPEDVFAVAIGPTAPTPRTPRAA